MTRESDAAPTAPCGQVIDSDDFGGDTMAHYLPIEPRKPAPTGEELPLQRPTTPEPLPIEQQTDEAARAAFFARAIRAASALAIELPIPTSAVERPRSIAELFQDMLRAAYQAGAVSESSGETFETWYQREVLQ